ncbi:MAG: hypothetical protein GW939_00765 [Candidatus Magasanikbacteria bacterium]|nr:hypothetical protein [Candidatus Magasanikbacteria bacterium]NCS71932.1 hypothetical protein [Candidatus Magasanikbacteria bacterium]
MKKYIVFAISIIVISLAFAGCNVDKPKEVTLQDAEIAGRFTVPKEAQNIHFQIETEPAAVFARFTIPEEQEQAFIDTLGTNNQTINYFGQQNAIIDTKTAFLWWQPVQLYEKKLIQKKEQGFEWNVVLGKTIEESSQNLVTIYLYNYEQK